MFIQGIAGVSRRLYDGGMQYQHASEVFGLNVISSWGAWMLAIAQLPFIINFIVSIFAGKKVPNDNPWDSTTIEWQAPSPPGHGNFETIPTVYRAAYEYSVPGASKDFVPQTQEELN